MYSTAITRCLHDIMIVIVYYIYMIFYDVHTYISIYSMYMMYPKGKHQARTWHNLVKCPSAWGCLAIWCCCLGRMNKIALFQRIQRPSTIQSHLTTQAFQPFVISVSQSNHCRLNCWILCRSVTTHDAINLRVLRWAQNIPACPGKILCPYFHLLVTFPNFLGSLVLWISACLLKSHWPKAFKTERIWSYTSDCAMLYLCNACQYIPRGHIHSVNTFQFVIFATRTLKLQSSLTKTIKEQTAWQMMAFQPCWTTPDGTVGQESLYTEDEVLLCQSTRFDIAHKKKRDKKVWSSETRNVISASAGGKPSLWLCQNPTTAAIHGEQCLQDLPRFRFNVHKLIARDTSNANLTHFQEMMLIPYHLILRVVNLPIS